MYNEGLAAVSSAFEEDLDHMKKSLVIVLALGVVGASQAATVFSENFNAGGTGVFTQTASNAAVAWAGMSTYADANYASTIAADQSNALTANDDAAGGVGAFDSLASANVNGVGFSGLTLSFDLNFQKFGVDGTVNSSDNDRFEVYANSTLLDTISSDVPAGGLYVNNSGVTKTYNLGAFDNSNFAIKFRYVDATTGAWEWYAQVDNVSVTGNAVPEPASMLAIGTGLAALVARRRRSK